MKITFTWDSAVAAQRIACLFRHRWEWEQVIVKAQHGDKEIELVVAFKICKRCAKSKLVHILT